MTIKCLIAIDTPDGKGFAEVHANSLHQLAELMPGSVLRYEICHYEEAAQSPVIQDSELFDLLAGVLADMLTQ